MSTSSSAPRRSAAGLAASVPAVALALVVAGAVAVFVAFPTYPAYDSLYSLLWAGEVLGRAAAGLRRLPRADPAPAAAAGRARARAVRRRGRAGVRRALPGGMVALRGGHVPARAAGGGRARAGSSPPALLLTRFNFGLLASKGYLDIPYCALLTWAIVLEAERPRRGRRGLVAARAGGAAAARGVAAGRACTGSGWAAAGWWRGCARCCRRSRRRCCGPRPTSSSPAIRCSRSTTPTRWPRSCSARSRTRRSRACRSRC